MSTEITYLYMDNITVCTSTIEWEHLTTVTPLELRRSGIKLAPQIPLKCYDNVFNTLSLEENANDDSLRFCLGLQQDKNDIDKVVEHCWLEKDGEYFDSSNELHNSNYYLFCSLSLTELSHICIGANLETLPTITTLRNLRDALE